MREFRDRVAVVTGAASGIGRGLAERFAEEGMKVVLADVEEDALRQAEVEMREKGFDVLGVRTDVSKAGDVEKLAQQTLDAFGAVHILCNNAGVVGFSGMIWESTLGDWEWVMGVNLWGGDPRRAHVPADHAGPGQRGAHREYGLAGRHHGQRGDLRRHQAGRSGAIGIHAL